MSKYKEHAVEDIRDIHAWYIDNPEHTLDMAAEKYQVSTPTLLRIVKA